MVSVFSLVVLLVTLQSYGTIPMFRATAQLLIDEEQSVMVTGMDASSRLSRTASRDWTNSRTRK